MREAKDTKRDLNLIKGSPTNLVQFFEEKICQDWQEKMNLKMTLVNRMSMRLPPNIHIVKPSKK
jgi:hypothetical protein